MSKIINPEIFSPSIEPLGSINALKALKWNTRYNSCGSFELWCPIIPENIELLKDDNILWIGGKEAGIVEVLDMDNEGRDMHIQGKFIGYQTYWRSLWDTHIYTNQYVSDILHDIVNVNCINPTDKKRIIENWKMGNISNKLGPIMSVQRTGDRVIEVIEEFTQAHNLGFYAEFNPFDKTIALNIYEGADKSLSQSVNPFVIFEYQTEDILKSKYFRNSLQYSNITLVAGEGEGAARKKIIVGDESLSGRARREMYTDARDVRSTGDNGESISVDDSLKQRGLEKLSLATVVESYDAIMRVDGNAKYEYGVDYDIGDIVTIKDDFFGITMNARLTEIQETWDSASGYSINIIFGYEQPTLSYKVT